MSDIIFLKLPHELNAIIFSYLNEITDIDNLIDLLCLDRNNYNDMWKLIIIFQYGKHVIDNIIYTEINLTRKWCNIYKCIKLYHYIIYKRKDIICFLYYTSFDISYIFQSMRTKGYYGLYPRAEIKKSNNLIDILCRLLFCNFFPKQFNILKHWNQFANTSFSPVSREKDNIKDNIKNAPQVLQFDKIDWKSLFPNLIVIHDQYFINKTYDKFFEECKNEYIENQKYWKGSQRRYVKNGGIWCKYPEIIYIFEQMILNEK